MTLNERTATYLVDAAVRAVESNPESFEAALDDIPAAIYVAASDGTITYFNKACVEAVGRLPAAGVDKWCVSWKLYTSEGEPMPHDRCPMAVAIQEGREVRGIEIVAERPDGTRARFIPYPTPLFDRDGALAGAVNLLVDVSDQPQPRYLEERAEQCRRLAMSVDDPHAAEALALMAAKYYEQARLSDK